MKVNDLTQTERDLQAVSVSSCREWWRTFLPPENVRLAYIMCTPCPVCRTSRTGMFIWTVNIFRVTIVILRFGFLSSLTQTKLRLLSDKGQVIMHVDKQTSVVIWVVVTVHTLRASYRHQKHKFRMTWDWSSGISLILSFRNPQIKRSDKNELAEYELFYVCVKNWSCDYFALVY